MGARISTSKKTVNIDTSLIIKRNTEIMIRNQTQTYSATTNINQFELTNKGEIIGNINVSQKIDIDKTVRATIDASTTNLLKEEIQNQLDAQSDQATKTTVGAIFVGLGVVTSEDRQNIKKSVEHAINKKITLENIQSIIDTTINTNDGKIINEGKIVGNVTVDQNIAVTIVIINLLNQVFSEANDFLLNNNSNLELKQSSETKFTGLEGYLLAGSGSSSCLLCICCIIILAFALSPAGQRAVNSASSR